MRILDPETRLEALEPCRLNCELMRAKMEEACREAAEAMRESEQLRNQLILRNDELLKLREQLPQWVSVEARLPKTGERVIVARADGKVEQGVYLGVNGYWKVYGANTKRVTHWMPLPEPPGTEDSPTGQKG